MREIPLTKGKVALVDDEDYERCAGLRWFAIAGNGGRGRWYAARRSGRGAMLLHRLLMNAPAGLQVDHIDGNGLNCQKSNMRLASHSQNQHNVGKRRDNTSGAKGVSWHKATERWQARIMVGRQSLYLGLFETREEAALAYDHAATQHHGEFAVLNCNRDVMT